MQHRTDAKCPLLTNLMDLQKLSDEPTTTLGPTSAEEQTDTKESADAELGTC